MKGLPNRSRRPFRHQEGNNQKDTLHTELHLDYKMRLQGPEPLHFRFMIAKRAECT